jgi:hypothetical protein
MPTLSRRFSVFATAAIIDLPSKPDRLKRVRGAALQRKVTMLVRYGVIDDSQCAHTVVSPWFRDENGIPTRTVRAVLPRRSFLLKEARSHDDKDRRQPDDALCPADWEVWS